MARKSHCACRTLMLAGVSSLVLVGGAFAQGGGAVHFDIPAEDLGKALAEVARQSGCEIVFNADLARGKRTAGLKGDFTARQALDRLLAGTGQSVHLGSHGEYLVATRTEPAQAIDPPADRSSAAPAEAAMLPVVTVIARRQEENIQKVPVAVTAIQTEALQNEDIVNPVELQFHSPSLQAQTTTGFFDGGYAIRGISGATSYFAEVPGGPTYFAAPIFDMSSVQILNGPQGTLFGRTNIAGAILFQPAKPNLNLYSGSIDITEGGRGLNRATAILNVPVIPSQLAVRIDLNRNYEEGYTKQLGTGLAFNNTNNYSVRLSVDWKPAGSRFEDYAMLNYFGADQEPSGMVLGAVNPNASTLQLPTLVNLGILTPTDLFGGTCAAAVSIHVASSVSTCVNQRYATLAGFLPSLQNELHRIDTGGPNAVDYTAFGSTAIQQGVAWNNFTFVNHLDYDFGNLGFTTLSVRDILGVQAQGGHQAYYDDGVGGDIVTAVDAFASGPANAGVTGCGQQQTHLDAPATGQVCKGPYAYAYTDELQFHGVAGGDLLTWTVGGYYEDDPVPKSLGGPPQTLRLFSGIFDPSYGWFAITNYDVGGASIEKAVYGQATLNLSHFAPFIAGLHVTGGVRDTWDSSSLEQRSVSEDPTTGIFSPGAAVPTQMSSSQGTDTTIAVDAQITHNWLIYGTTRTAYVPGGINAQINATNLPNYGPTYGPKPLVKDYEMGSKLDWTMGDAHARLNVAAYQLDFTNIQEVFGATVQSGDTTTVAVYTGNAAAARVKGAELQGELIFHNWDITANYSYTDARFTKWFGSDPLSIETVPGSSYCVTPPSTVNSCVLNLAATPYPNVPKHQLSLVAEYSVPIGQDRGTLLLSGSAFYQSREWLTLNTLRDLQVYGSTLGVDTLTKALSQPSYAKFNLKVDWQNIFGSRFSVALFVDNVTDVHYAVEDNDGLSSLGYLWKLYGEPRTEGLELRYQFGG